ncbi:MAG: hypothetical protein MUE36_10425 [Acidimicrobiales bacterium]|jgi:hypothetical protein|nr:hypothetical protein [Acidimicrobiales bacterium]
MPASSVRFAAAARTLGRAARRRGLQVPGFRSPPRLRDADRSLRRSASGSATVSVRLKGRPWAAVLADMIEGVVAANGLVGPTADAARTALWAAVEREGVGPAMVEAEPRWPRAVRSEGAERSSPARPLRERHFPARLPGEASAGPRPSAGRLRSVPAADVA